MTSRRALQGTLLVLACVPIVTGTLSVVGGTGIIGGGDGTHPNVESELRFYAAFYVGFGVFIGSLAPRIEQRGRELRTAAAVLVLAASGRAIAIVSGREPDTLFVVLMAVELAIAAGLVTWQAQVARAAR